MKHVENALPYSILGRSGSRLAGLALCLVAAGAGGCSVLLAETPCDPGGDSAAGADSGADPDTGAAARGYRLASAGSLHSCGVDTDETLLCWGLDEDGQAEPPGLADPVRALAAGHAHSCAAVADGPARCWGRDDDGQVSGLPATTLVTVDAGGAHSCGLDADGRVHCWGRDTEGQATVPAALGAGQAEVVAGWLVSCARDAAGATVCWGDDSTGLVTAVPAVSLVELSLGRDHALGRDAAGGLHCWGAAAPCAAVAAVAPAAVDRVVATRDGGCVGAAGAALACGTTRGGIDPLVRDVPTTPGLVPVDSSPAALHACGRDPAAAMPGLVCWGDDAAGQATPPT